MNEIYKDIQSILALSDIHPADCIKINNLIVELIEENQKQKEVIDRLNFIKNRKNQGASQENINKMAIKFVNSYLNEVE